MNFASPSEFSRSGLLPQIEPTGGDRVEVFGSRRQFRRVVAAACHDLEILLYEIRGIAARVREDLFGQDAERGIPIGAENHIRHLLDKNRRVMAERLSHHHLHPEGLVSPDGVGRPEAE